MSAMRQRMSGESVERIGEARLRNSAVPPPFLCPKGQIVGRSGSVGLFCNHICYLAKESMVWYNKMLLF